MRHLEFPKMKAEVVVAALLRITLNHANLALNHANLTLNLAKLTLNHANLGSERLK